jgi:hypothetical protein
MGMSQLSAHLVVVLCVWTSVAGAESDLELVAEIDAAVAKGVEFLAAKQSPDGAWRSHTYAPFKEGDALSPLVMTALLRVALDDRAKEPCQRGMQYLVKLSKRTFEDKDGIRSLAYPIYTAANTTIALHHYHRPEGEPIRAKWQDAIRDLQFSEKQGWEKDVRYGGWGYGSHVPKQGSPIGPPDEPNLSATRFAVVALSAVGGNYESDSSIRKASAFIARCHNYRITDKNRNDAFFVDDETGDGGFFFLPTDLARNKAGAQKNAPSGIASYGSATADGMWAASLSYNRMLLVNYEYERALNWFHKHLDVNQVPGQYSADREGIRNGVYYYYMAALAQGLTLSGISPTSKEWAARLRTALLQRQRDDGSWKNEVVDQREDDPIVATALAIQALTACRKQFAVDGRK